MTSEQTEELAALKAALKQHIEEAEKATPGPWSNSDIGLVNDHTAIAVCDCEQLCYKEDAVFIARARTMSPLACRIALAGIESFEAAHNYAISQGWPSMTEDDLLKLLTIWKGGKP